MIELTPIVQIEILGAVVLFLAVGVLLGWVLKPRTAECGTCQAIREALAGPTCIGHYIVDWSVEEPKQPVRILTPESFDLQWTNPRFTSPVQRKIVGWTRKNGKFDKPIYEGETGHYLGEDL